MPLLSQSSTKTMLAHPIITLPLISAMFLLALISLSSSIRRKYLRAIISFYGGRKHKILSRVLSRRLEVLLELKHSLLIWLISVGTGEWKFYLLTMTSYLVFRSLSTIKLSKKAME